MVTTIAPSGSNVLVAFVPTTTVNMCSCSSSTVLLCTYRTYLALYEVLHTWHYMKYMRTQKLYTPYKRPKPPVLLGQSTLPGKTCSWGRESLEL